MNKKIFYFLLLISGVSLGQDIHFSLFNEMPINVNPALMGISEHSMKAGMIYRNQWNSISTPFQSSGLFGEYRFEPKFLSGHTFGLGLQFLNDVAGKGAFKQNHLNLAINYIKFIDRSKKHMVAGAIKAGYLQKSIDATNLAYEADFDYATGGFISAGGNEAYSGTLINGNRFDFGLGLTYTHFNKLGNRSVAGVAFDHLFNSNVSLLPGGVNPIGLKTTIYGKSTVQMNQRAVLHPTVMLNFQNKATKYLAGAEMIYSIGRALIENTDIRAGIYYRVNDAAVASLGINHDNWSILFSYDFTTSNLGEAAKNVNAFEISINIRNKIFKPKSMKYIVPGQRFL